MRGVCNVDRLGALEGEGVLDVGWFDVISSSERVNVSSSSISSDSSCHCNPIADQSTGLRQNDGDNWGEYSDDVISLLGSDYSSADRNADSLKRLSSAVMTQHTESNNYAIFIRTKH